MADDALLISKLRSFLGAERFRRFLVALEERQRANDLHFWQDRDLDGFTAATGIAVPRSPRELACHLAPAFRERRTLDSADVPDWMTVEDLGGRSPVQGQGTVLGWRWYFRARWGEWSVAAAAPGGDPCDVFSDSETSFYHEEPYGDGRYDAGSMPVSEARFFILRELSRLKKRLER